MGSCQCANSTEPALNLPDEEVSLAHVEQKHPFSAKSFELILSKIPDHSISRGEFLSISSSLGISPIAFQEGPFFRFVESLTDSSDQINNFSLKLCAILLGVGTPNAKMYALFNLYKNNECKIGFEDIWRMIQDLCNIAAFVLPQMLDLPDMVQYVANLQVSIPLVIKKTTSLFRVPVTFQGFQEIYMENRFLQKMFWANGIRMILVEELVKSGMNNSFKRNKMKVPQYPKPPKNAVSDDDMPEEYTNNEETVIMINVDIGNSKQDYIVLRNGDDFEKVTRSFANKHQLTLRQTKQLLRNIRKLDL